MFSEALFTSSDASVFLFFKTDSLRRSFFMLSPQGLSDKA
jgi:hypothetical protein